MMTCFDFEIRLQELFDLRQVELPEELSAHVEHCSACREIAEGFVLLHDSIAEWRLQIPPVQLSDSILARQQHAWLVKGEQVAPIDSICGQFNSSPERRPSSVASAALLASAIALLIGLGLAWRASGNISFAKRQSHAEPTVAKSSLQMQPVVQSNSAGDRQLDVLLHDARDAYVALASQAWQQVSTASLLVPSSDTSVPFRDGHATQDVSEPLARPLAPLGKELRDAVDSWFQQVFNTQDSST